MTTQFAVQYTRYEQRPRSANSQGSYIDSIWSNREDALRRAALLDEPAKGDYQSGTRTQVFEVQLDPNVYLGNSTTGYVQESEPKHTDLEWKIECQVNDLEQAEQALLQVKAGDYESDEEFKDDVAYLTRSIVEGEARLAELKEEFSAKVSNALEVSQYNHTQKVSA